MSDIDFDELDRAVTSVLNGGEPKVAPAPVQPPIDLTPVATPIESPKPIAASAQDLHPAAARPVQRGRFLDMVHPAQAMGPRTSPTVQPLSRPTAVVSQTTNQTFVSDVVSTTASTPPTPAEPTPIVETANTPTVPRVAPTEVPAIVNAPETPAEPADFFAEGPTSDKPTEPTPSPFIADAKVEKRPLGAFATADSAALPVGDELHEKLVAVESEDNVIETAESPIPVKVVEPTPVVTAVVPPVDKKDATSKKNGLLLPEHSAKNRLDKPPKHGKGALIWITVLVAVVLIGGGVGATLYFFILQ